MTFRRWTADGRPPHRAIPRVPGLLLDRDGCLVEDVVRPTRPDQLVAVPGAAEALARARHRGVVVAVVTNQSAIGRGLVDEQGMAALHARLVELVGPVAAVYHCPHHPDDRCACRKPSPVMPVAAVHDLGLDPARTCFVGDTITDVQAAMAAGIGARLVRTGHGARHAAAAAALDVTVAADVAEAVADHLDTLEAT